MPDYNHSLSPEDREHIGLLRTSYLKVTGEELGGIPPSPNDPEETLHEAPFVIASHGVEDDPILNYGNLTALRLWEASWEAFTSMPSRLTAEPVERSERERLLAAVTARGFIDDYSGIRISTSGKRFRIDRATVWNVVDEEDHYRGQAVIFRDWEFV
jgi:hypothetical protein